MSISFGMLVLCIFIYIFQFLYIFQLILTLFGVLSGYNGTHPFERPGQSYEGYPSLIYLRVVRYGATFRQDTITVKFL